GRARTQPRLAVRVRRRPDIAALDVRDDDESRRSCGAEDVLERAVPGGSVALEERRLGLDDGRAAAGGLDHPEPEVARARRAVREAPAVEEPGVRVDPDAEPAGRRRRGGE